MRRLMRVTAEVCCVAAGILAFPMVRTGENSILHAQILAVTAPTIQKQGSGLIVRADDECLAIVPKHVTSPGPREVNLTDIRGRSFPGSVIYQDPQADLAVIRPQFPTPAWCEEWLRAEEIRALLAGSRYGYLLYAAPSGAVQRVEVEISLPPRGTDITIWPRDPALQLHEGMSGGGLYVDGIPVGILVEAPVPSRRGIVYPLQFVWERIRRSSAELPSPWVRTQDMELLISRAAVVASACATQPKVRANWERGDIVPDARCEREWIVVDFESLRSMGLVRTGGYYCVRIGDSQGAHRSFRRDPSWRSRTYFSDGESVGVRVNETDIVITERAYLARFDDRCRFRDGR